VDRLIDRGEYAALGRCVYLNQAALGLIPARSTAAMLRFISEVAQFGNLRLADDEELRVLDELRAAAASLLGVPRASVAIIGGASEALGQAAALVERADASVVLVSSDFPSVSYPWLAAARRSPTRIDTVDDRGDEDLTSALLDAIVESTTAVSFSAVQYATGTKVDVRAVADRAHEVGARVIVDATQLAGAGPVDMTAWDADAVVTSGYKWLSSHGGAAILALCPELVEETPRLVGWKGTAQPFAFDPMTLPLAPDARRFEMSTIAYVSAVGLCESITMLSELDPARIQAHARRLATNLVEQVRPLGWAPFRDLSDPAASGHIVALAHPTLSSTAVQRALASEHDVICSDRNGRIRVSLHAYNDDSDIEALVNGLADVGVNRRGGSIPWT
jgi:cysteine desulfurase/selenocysteine lyase